MEKTGVDAVKDVKEFIDKNSRCPECHRNYNAYYFNRIPLKTKEWFNKWVKEELSDDRGMGLKWLCDFYNGVLGKGSERAEAKADDALNQLNELKAVEPQNEKKPRLNVQGDRLGG